LVEFLRLEGLSRGLEAVAQALDRAKCGLSNAFRAYSR
jgi:hypothetical protein